MERKLAEMTENNPEFIQIELEGGPQRGTMTVRNRFVEVWLHYLGGKSTNIRCMEALYTFSRVQDGKIIFRYRRSRDFPPDAEHPTAGMAAQRASFAN